MPSIKPISDLTADDLMPYCGSFSKHETLLFITMIGQAKGGAVSDNYLAKLQGYITHSSSFHRITALAQQLRLAQKQCFPSTVPGLAVAGEQMNYTRLATMAALHPHKPMSSFAQELACRTIGQKYVEDIQSQAGVPRDVTPLSTTFSDMPFYGIPQVRTMIWDLVSSQFSDAPTPPPRDKKYDSASLSNDYTTVSFTKIGQYLKYVQDSITNPPKQSLADTKSQGVFPEFRNRCDSSDQALDFIEKMQQLVDSLEKNESRLRDRGYRHKDYIYYMFRLYHSLNEALEAAHNLKLAPSQLKPLEHLHAFAFDRMIGTAHIRFENIHDKVVERGRRADFDEHFNDVDKWFKEQPDSVFFLFAPFFQTEEWQQYLAKIVNTALYLRDHPEEVTEGDFGILMTLAGYLLTSKQDTINKHLDGIQAKIAVQAIFMGLAIASMLSAATLGHITPMTAVLSLIAPSTESLFSALEFAFLFEKYQSANANLPPLHELASELQHLQAAALPADLSQQHKWLSARLSEMKKACAAGKVIDQDHLAQPTLPSADSMHRLLLGIGYRFEAFFEQSLAGQHDLIVAASAAKQSIALERDESTLTWVMTPHGLNHSSISQGWYSQLQAYDQDAKGSDPVVQDRPPHLIDTIPHALYPESAPKTARDGYVFDPVILDSIIQQVSTDPAAQNTYRTHIANEQYHKIPSMLRLLLSSLCSKSGLPQHFHQCLSAQFLLKDAVSIGPDGRTKPTFLMPPTVLSDVSSVVEGATFYHQVRLIYDRAACYDEMGRDQPVDGYIVHDAATNKLIRVSIQTADKYQTVTHEEYLEISASAHKNKDERKYCFPLMAAEMSVAYSPDYAAATDARIGLDIQHSVKAEVVNVQIESYLPDKMLYHPTSWGIVDGDLPVKDGVFNPYCEAGSTHANPHWVQPRQTATMTPEEARPVTLFRKNCHLPTRNQSDVQVLGDRLQHKSTLSRQMVGLLRLLLLAPDSRVAAAQLKSATGTQIEGDSDQIVPREKLEQLLHDCAKIIPDVSAELSKAAPVFPGAIRVLKVLKECYTESLTEEDEFGHGPYCSLENQTLDDFGLAASRKEGLRIYKMIQSSIIAEYTLFNKFIIGLDKSMALHSASSPTWWGGIKKKSIPEQRHLECLHKMLVFFIEKQQVLKKLLDSLHSPVLQLSTLLPDIDPQIEIEKKAFNHMVRRLKKSAKDIKQVGETHSRNISDWSLELSEIVQPYCHSALRPENRYTRITLDEENQQYCFNTYADDEPYISSDACAGTHPYQYTVSDLNRAGYTTEFNFSGRGDSYVHGVDMSDVSVEHQILSHMLFRNNKPNATVNNSAVSDNCDHLSQQIHSYAGLLEYIRLRNRIDRTPGQISFVQQQNDRAKLIFG